MNKFKIPTLLGLSIIFIGIIAGVILVLREQIFISQASPAVNIQDILISNISDTEIVISWQTSAASPAFVTLGQANPHETTALDDRDTQTPTARLLHYVTIKNLLPKTTYQYKIISGKTQSAISQFTTAAPLDHQAGFRPIIGTVLDKDQPLDEGVIFLSIADATTQSALVKSGNFLIPLSQIRKSDLSDIFPLSQDSLAKLTVVSAKGQANVLFKLNSPSALPPIKLGENIELTSIVEIYDLNSDGKVNAADNAIILQNFGLLREASKKPKDKRADLNGDGKVDQKDLDLMAKQINQ